MDNLTDPQDITEKLAETFYKNSSNENYNNTFLTFKENAEKDLIATQDKTDDINKTLTKLELMDALQSMKKKKNVQVLME